MHIYSLNGVAKCNFRVIIVLVKYATYNIISINVGVKPSRKYIISKGMKFNFK